MLICIIQASGTEVLTLSRSILCFENKSKLVLKLINSFLIFLSYNCTYLIKEERKKHVSKTVHFGSYNSMQSNSWMQK